MILFTLQILDWHFKNIFNIKNLLTLKLLRASNLKQTDHSAEDFRILVLAISRYCYKMKSGMELLFVFVFRTKGAK